MKRNKHSLSHYNLLTCDMGELIPIGTYEVLPGDSVQQATSLLVRVSPLMAPVMHPVHCRVHHWYVPYRLLWDGFEDFITGGSDGDDQSVFPTITTPEAGWGQGGLMDYLGVPPLTPGLRVNALPVRAYNMIYNEFYRDQDLATEVGQHSTSIQKVSWEKDYFSSARPWPQKGPDVTLPLIDGDVPVRSSNSDIQLRHPQSGKSTFISAGGTSMPDLLGVNINDADARDQMQFGAQTGLHMAGADFSAININDLRKAFALQRWAEARARYGSRYVEYLRYLGVRSSDARLQRPEYLGGGKQTISFSEVLQTGPDSDGSGVAQMRGHGISAMRSRRFRRFFEEHGVVISLLSVRPRTMYANALHKMWSRRTREDFWQKELEHIGQQEVYSREVFAQSDSNGGADVFGYQDRYAEYRHLQSRVTADFRTTLSDWHLARMFAAKPVLNKSFINCEPSKRIYAEQTQDALWIMANHSIQARRMVSRSAAPRIY